MPPDLAIMQRRFRAAMLSDSDGDAAPLIDANAAGRISIYRNTVRQSLADVLATAFPVTRRIVGAVFFAGLADGFIIKAPPRVPQLLAYGRDFADFIAGQDVGQRLAYLADVARLEWLRGEAYFAADAPPLDPQRLAALSPDAMERLVLDMHPATRLLCSTHPIHRIWEVNQPKIVEVPKVDMSVAQCVLISRRDHHVVVREIGAGDATFISALARGKPLGEAAGATLAQHADFDLQRALQDHFIHQTFRD
jgi:hypothetical protein